jgi:hypothetical protein
MVQIATGPNVSLELRGRMNAVLAPHVYPKRKAFEVVADQDASLARKAVLEVVLTPEVPPE